VATGCPDADPLIYVEREILEMAHAETVTPSAEPRALADCGRRYVR
jgi:hypothetical protein